jgi:Fe-S-cluster-containing hydrogenase component 2
MNAKEIVVISGKGGSGKTSLSASFAYLEAKNAIIADCDVDAANMHILLGADFEKQEDFMSGEVAVISEDLCTNCGDCYNVCRFDAITKMDDFHKVDPIACEGCWYCSRVCGHGAIEMLTQKAGDVFVSNIKNNWSTATGGACGLIGFNAVNLTRGDCYMKARLMTLPNFQRGGAWPSSVRAAKCSVKSDNERDPHLMEPFTNKRFVK